MASHQSELPIWNVPFVEEQYARWLADESAVDEEWRAYFRALGPKNGLKLGPSFRPTSIFASRAAPKNGAAALAGFDAHAAMQDRVVQLVQAYRFRGHMFADLDPLDLAKVQAPDISLEEFGLTEADLDKTFTAGGRTGTLRELIDHFQATYCRSIGAEFAHIELKEMRTWLRDEMEATRNRLELSHDEQIDLLTKLIDAETFEQFLHLRFQGAKRFSLEGAESLIPLCDRIVTSSAAQGVREIVVGMAHRGRLNVLANVMGKPARDIFAEFADEDPNLYIGRGDVKYHLGHSTDREIGGKTVHLSMAFNPSHLEFVDPVVTGRVRAKQDRRGDVDRREVLSILIHGDAAFSGQGIVAELFNMAGLRGYTTGGTIHVVVNNQIGFTTMPEDARSTRYATDVAKIVGAPILHVNGEDPEAVAQVVRLAVGFRQKFQRDVVIDLYCYRKYGHNEADEPAFTQPVMYRAIANHPSVREQFTKKLVQLGEMTQEQVDRIAVERRAALEEQLAETKRGYRRRKPSAMAGLWAKYAGGADRDSPEVPTALAKAELQELGRRLVALPETFKLNPKLAKNLVEARREMAEGTRPLDWGMGESLAYASLVAQGAPVRLSGQDVERGTFSHRHATFFDFETGARHIPLQHVKPGQARFEVYNSPLSEVSVLGYEYGYSLDTPDGLVIWEAQFGDFVNAAQVISDQFIVSGEDKWHRLSGLTLLLPHGYEGQGPEHSSARLERWLNQCAEDNIQVANCTTPAQIFHLLRRQVVRPYRKPLVVMSPKSLLRHPEATSTLDELATGTFRRVIPDALFAPGGQDPSKVSRVLLCTGKIYYELARERREHGRNDVAIVRVEQLYPTPLDAIAQALAPFAGAREIVWVQEEPRNQGARIHMYGELTRSGFLKSPLLHVSRPPSASPATGSHASHGLEQRQIHEAAFAPIVHPS